MITPMDRALVYRVTIPGSPGPAKVNGRFTPVVKIRRVRGRPKHYAEQVKSKLYRAWVNAAALIMRRAEGPRFPDGSLAARITAYWPKKHRQPPAAGLAWGDVDAVVKAVLDALTKAKVVGDDAQFVRCELVKAHDKDAPRIEVEVWRAE